MTVQEYTMRIRNILGQVEGMGELDKVQHFIEGLKPAI